MTVNPRLSFDPVILSIIRRVWPQIIAQSIVGVQPMSFSAIITMTNTMYRYFLRLNNRKSKQTIVNFTKADYPVVWLDYKQQKNRKEILNWCRSVFLPGSWATNRHDVIAFSNENQFTLFKLTWDL